MSSRSRSVSASVLLLSALALAGCGGPEGVRLLAGSMSGEYQGEAFTPTFGIAFERSAESKLIIFSDLDLHCESPNEDEPPSGHPSTLGLKTLEVGTYGMVIVNLMRNIGGDFEGRGSNAGHVVLSMSTAETVTGSVAYQHTDDEGLSYKLNGDFQVTRCPL